MYCLISQLSCRHQFIWYCCRTLSWILLSLNQICTFISTKYIITNLINLQDLWMENTFLKLRKNLITLNIHVHQSVWYISPEFVMPNSNLPIYFNGNEIYYYKSMYTLSVGILITIPFYLINYNYISFKKGCIMCMLFLILSKNICKGNYLIIYFLSENSELITVINKSLHDDTMFLMV